MILDLDDPGKPCGGLFVSSFFVCEKGRDVFDAFLRLRVFLN